MMEEFWNELNEGEIYARDNLQFELKSEFFVNPHLKQNVYKQEVYLFIPNSLQINAETYSREQFYLDQTNLIRYKTPLMTLTDLANLEYSPSPLTRLRYLLNKSDPSLFIAAASDELKLFAAIFRAALYEHVYKMVKNFTEMQDSAKISKSIAYLCSEINEVCHKFRQLQEIAHSRSDCPQLIRHFRYVDEFTSLAIDECLIFLLRQYRSKEFDRNTDRLITQLVIKEKLYRKKNHLGPKSAKGNIFGNESILYRYGLLHRFVLESLMLKNFRFSPQEKHRNILGAFAAGFAMLVYLSIFLFWGGTTFVIDSFPLIVFAVFSYILKDRIKEGFKTLYSKQAHLWFPDYSTEITSYKGFKVGRLTENFAFINANQLPPGFLQIRNHHFHEELQTLQRHDNIIQYKREMTLHSPLKLSEGRRREITAIFGLNIHHILQKASNAFQPSLTLDTYTQEISERLLPKVYHLNLIIRNSFLQDDMTPKVEIKTYRVVVDKNGIKRVEHIKPT